MLIKIEETNLKKEIDEKKKSNIFMGNFVKFLQEIFAKHGNYTCKMQKTPMD